MLGTVEWGPSSASVHRSPKLIISFPDAHPSGDETSVCTTGKPSGSVYLDKARPIEFVVARIRILGNGEIFYFQGQRSYSASPSRVKPGDELLCACAVPRARIFALPYPYGHISTQNGVYFRVPLHPAPGWTSLSPHQNFL